MSTPHTPGPWTQDRLADRTKIRGAGQPLASVDNTTDEGTANACLIAAAPEMLAALKETQALCMILCTTVMNKAVHDHLPFGTLDAVKKWLSTSQDQFIIRRAEGR